LCKKYYSKNLQGVSELTETRGDFLGRIILLL